MNTKLYIVVGAVVLAGVSFYGGTYYAAMGGRLFVPGTGQESRTGRVVESSSASFTIELPDGSQKTLSLSPQTQVVASAPVIPKDATDIVPGARVLVIYSGGEARQVQLITSSVPTPIQQ